MDTVLLPQCLRQICRVVRDDMYHKCLLLLPPARAVLTAVGDEGRIYRHQELYSDTVASFAMRDELPLVVDNAQPVGVAVGGDAQIGSHLADDVAHNGSRQQGRIVRSGVVGVIQHHIDDDLRVKGLKHQLAESTASQAAAAVTYQYPHAGAKVAYGTTVYLYTDTYEGSHTEVPDVTGKSADFARQMLSAAGLNCVVEGSGTVQAQSAEPGSSVQRGTIVTITCG